MDFEVLEYGTLFFVRYKKSEQINQYRAGKHHVELKLQDVCVLD